MSIRGEVIRLANWWAAPGSYQPLADELKSFFTVAGCEEEPTLADAQEAIDSRPYGVMVHGSLKHWCGIFACSILVRAGLNTRWTLLGGKMVGPGVVKIGGSKGIVPGDVAQISAGSHHFIVTEIDYGSNTLSSVDGNSGHQLIRSRTDHKVGSIVAYYRLIADIG